MSRCELEMRNYDEFFPLTPMHLSLWITWWSSMAFWGKDLHPEGCSGSPADIDLVPLQFREQMVG